MKTQIKNISLTFGLICGLFLSAYTQNMNVTGKVTNAKNQPLAGVSVSVKGTQLSVKTTTNGEYKITTQTGKILVFSLSGYTKKEVTVKGAKHDVVLVPVAKPVAKDKIVIVEDCYDYDIMAYDMKVSAISEYQAAPAYSPYLDYNLQNNEEYSQHAENRFTSVKDAPLSTFSLDVDAASYSNMRRMVNQGQMPQKDAVRVEEFINYFSYDYPQPVDGHPVSIVTEVASCPWATGHTLVRIGVKAKEIASENLPASNFVFLIDVSGSMYGPTRLDLVKASLKLLVNNLRDKDRVAIVVYAGAAGEVLPSTEGSDKQKIMEAIDKLTAGGSTAGGAGIQLAYKIAEKNFVSGGNNRIVLCTDGDFNVGVSSNQDLESLIESKRKTGVFLTVLGYGMGNYKDSKLQTLAQKGNGNHAYIDNLQEANKVLVNEFGGTMYTVAKDVKIQVEFNPAYVKNYRLVGYESRLLNKEDFNDDTKDAGELGSGHTVTAIYEIIPVGVKNPYGEVDKLKYQDEDDAKVSPVKSSSNELLTVKLRYKKPDEDHSSKMEVPVTADSKTQVSEDFKFAMAVAMFAQLLKDSDFKGTATYQQVIKLANEGIGKDKHGYRKEFVRLAESVNQLAK